MQGQVLTIDSEFQPWGRRESIISLQGIMRSAKLSDICSLAWMGAVAPLRGQGILSAGGAGRVGKHLPGVCLTAGLRLLLVASVLLFATQLAHVADAGTGPQLTSNFELWKDRF
jgi:hypothetical protein